MQKTRNLALLACSAAVLCSALVCGALNAAGVPLPEEVAPSDHRSNLEGRAYTEPPSPSLGSFLDGAFQRDLESYVADSIPFRDDILMANAALQRASIKTMASLCNYSIYPTFFDSDIIFSEANGAVYEMPIKTSRAALDKMEKVLANYKAFATEHPELNCYFAMPTRSNVLSFDPYASLTSSAISNGTFRNLISSTLGETVTYVDIFLDDFDEFDKQYFKTDHHWNMDGAYAAYCTLATALGFKDQLVQPGDALRFDIGFYGSNARKGLDAEGPADSILDYEFDLPEFDLFVDGEPVETQFLANTKKYQDGAYSTAPFYNYYSNYFHSDKALLTLQVKESRNGRTLLIVGDSYTNSIERLFTAHYDTIYVYDPRHATQTLSEFVDKHEVNDVLVCLCYQTLNASSTSKTIR